MSIASAQALASLMTSSLLHFEEINQQVRCSRPLFSIFHELDFSSGAGGQMPSRVWATARTIRGPVLYRVGQLVGFAVGVRKQQWRLANFSGNAASAAFFFAGEKDR